MNSEQIIASDITPQAEAIVRWRICVITSCLLLDDAYNNMLALSIDNAIANCETQLLL